MADPDLAPGTAVQVVRLDYPQRLVAASITGRATSELECKAMLEGREGLIGSLPAQYYTVTEWSDDDAEMAIGVVGDATAVSIADGHARLDLNGDGEQEVFAICTTSEGIRFGLWTGEPYLGNPVWIGYYYLGYDLEPSCPQD
jgi:hypothetical protein